MPVPDVPVTSPRALIAAALLKSPPSVPRSVIVPRSQTHACVSPLLIQLCPATRPEGLMQQALLLSPPSVPRSCIVPSHRNACSPPVGGVLSLIPTTSPRGLIAAAWLNTSGPPSVPRSIAVNETGAASGTCTSCEEVGVCSEAQPRTHSRRRAARMRHLPVVVGWGRCDRAAIRE